MHIVGLTVIAFFVLLLVVPAIIILPLEVLKARRSQRSGNQP